MILHHKRVTKSGAITIPKEIRNNLHLESGKKVSIKVTDDGDLLLVLRDTCHICDTHTNIIQVNGLSLCAECLEIFNDKKQRRIKNIKHYRQLP